MKAGHINSFLCVVRRFVVMTRNYLFLKALSNLKVLKVFQDCWYLFIKKKKTLKCPKVEVLTTCPVHTVIV